MTKNSEQGLAERFTALRGSHSSAQALRYVDPIDSSRNICCLTLAVELEVHLLLANDRLVIADKRTVFDIHVM